MPKTQEKTYALKKIKIKKRIHVCAGFMNGISAYNGFAWVCI